MKPLVSILIPAYNAEPWIADTIRSALGQTWPRKEVIVVDDGSTDQTLSIARKFSSKEISVASQENLGVCAARNRAYDLCQGDYIQWLDADDLLSSNKIANQLEGVQESQDKKILLSCGWGYFAFRTNKARFVPTALWHDLSPVEWLQRRWEGNLHMNPATWLTSRELSDAAGRWDTRLLGGGADDGEYFSRVVLAANGIRFVPEARVFYRITGSGRLSHIGRSSKKRESLLLAMQLQIGQVRSLDDGKRSRAACVKYLQTWLPTFYPERPDIVKQLEQLASTLGGQLNTPHWSWKYAWIEKLFGFAAAKYAQSGYVRGKSSALRAWDKIMYGFDHRSPLPSQGIVKRTDFSNAVNSEVSRAVPSVTPPPASASEKHFATDHLLTNLRQRMISSGLVTTASQGAQFFLNLAYIMVLARLLLPQEFGLVAMVTTIMGFLRIFQDAGLSTATVQQKEITHAQVSNLFWVNVVVGAITTVLMAASAPAIAWFFREPRLVGITLVLSITFLFASATAQHTAIFNRQMRFSVIAAIDVTSMFVGYLAGICMALWKYGYWALVAASVTQVTVKLVLAWSVLQWRPQLPSREGHTWHILRFGANLTAGTFMYSFSRGADSLLIGRFFGAAAVGLYSRGSILLIRPLEHVILPIYAVLIPTLSRLQDRADHYRRTFLDVFEGMALMSFLFAGPFLALSYPVTVAVLGPRWEAAAVIFAGFSVAALAYPLVTASIWLFWSQGRGKDWVLTSAIVSSVSVCSFLAGLPFGPAGVAISYSASCVLIQAPVVYYIAGRQGPVSTRDLWAACLRHLPVWGIVCGTAFLARTFVLEANPWIQLLLCGPLALLAGAAYIAVSPPSRRVAANLFSVVRDLKTRTLTGA
jgi:O-antigen/teichoic acid export membrane protein/glycosyltransferase involved in cell wall biosynthesis